jgi:hypothetical protein
VARTQVVSIDKASKLVRNLEWQWRILVIRSHKFSLLEFISQKKSYYIFFVINTLFVKYLQLYKLIGVMIGYIILYSFAVGCIWWSIFAIKSNLKTRRHRRVFTADIYDARTFLVSSLLKTSCFCSSTASATYRWWIPSYLWDEITLRFTALSTEKHQNLQKDNFCKRIIHSWTIIFHFSTNPRLLAVICRTVGLMIYGLSQASAFRTKNALLIG